MSAFANESLQRAKEARFDEYFTRLEDVEKELENYAAYNKDIFRDKTILCPCDTPESSFTAYFRANFKRFGLRQIICTSLAKSSKKGQENETDRHGKVCTIIREENGKPAESVSFLQGDGDFRSEEVTRLRDETDMIVTNEPFSLFSDFLKWVTDGNRQFILIGSMNAVTYKEVFPLIRDGKIWLGTTYPKVFVLPDRTEKHFGNICWFTNIDHGIRHQPLSLRTMEENLRENKRLQKKLVEKYGQDPEHLYYPRFDNFDALEVPVTDAIPSDYAGVMGVPISALAVAENPEQFEIIGLIAGHLKDMAGIPSKTGKYGTEVEGKLRYGRILVKRTRRTFSVTTKEKTAEG